MTLPSRFRYPEDAREQLRRARSYMQEKLGTAPVGLWPSEGSVSDEALAMAADCGFRWAATDNGVLARTLGQDAGVDVTYQAYIGAGGPRDGFVVPRSLPERLDRVPIFADECADAAGHFLDGFGRTPRAADALVPIVLDGENAWEWYEANGRPFLRELYRRISEDPELEAVTVSEALARYPSRGLWTGSFQARGSTRISTCGSERRKTTSLGSCSWKPVSSMRPARATVSPSGPQVGLRRAADRRRERLELVVRPRARLR